MMRAFGVWRLAFGVRRLASRLEETIAPRTNLMCAHTNNYELEIAMRRAKRRLVRQSLPSHWASPLYLLGSWNPGDVGTPNAERQTPSAER
jgi:hypothetical protein